MKLSKDKQKAMLLENFEILNKNYTTNYEAIADLIGLMFKIDVTTAVDMWEHLLRNNQHIVKQKNPHEPESIWVCHDEVYHLTDGIYFAGVDAIGENEITNIVLTNPYLKSTFFEITGHVYNAVRAIIRNRLENNEAFVVNELMELLEKNPNNGTRLCVVLKGAIPYSIDSEAAYALLDDWINRVSEEEEKAKLKVALMKACK